MRWFALLILLLPSLASAHSTYTNEPVGSTQFYYCNFNSGSLCGMADLYNSMSDEFVTPGGSGTMASPSGALRMRTEGGNGSGTGEVYFPSKQREVFVGFTWRNEVYGYVNNNNKMVFIADPTNSFLVLQGSAGRNCKTLKWYQQEGVNNTHVSGVFNTNWPTDGTGWFEPNINGSVASQCWGGPWAKVEIYLKGSTTNTSQDGIIKIWVNGTLSTSHTNINQGTQQTDFPGGFRYLGLNQAWDGCAGVCAPGGEIWQHFYEDLYISFPNCVSGCTTADSTPPSQATGLGVSMSGTTATLTWAAASDNVGVTGYLVEKCAGAGCTNFVLDQTVTGLSASIANLTASTTYAFRVRARDASANFGAYSATVTGTTTAGEVERTLATDTFTRADGALGANWTGSYSSLFDLAIVSTAVRGSSTSNDNIMAYTAISPPADQWAQVDISTATGSALYAAGVTVRTAASPLTSYYMCRFLANAWAGATIEKLVNGTYTLLTSTATTSFAAGDKLKCTARGSTITLLRIRSGVESVILTTTDSTHTSGRTGVITYASTIANLEFDNFTTGDWAVPAAAPTISNLTTDATGANVTWTGDPAFIRIQTYTASGIFSDVVEPIASFPSGRYTNSWAVSITSGCFFARDASGVENTNASAYRCAAITPASADTTPPVLSSLLPTGTLVQGTTSTQLSVVTNETATCKWADTDVAYASMGNTFSTANGTSHSATKSGLSNGTSYTVYVRCTDAASTPNVNTSSSAITFSVASAPPADSTAPSTVTGVSCAALSTSQIQCSWTAATDNVAVASYSLYASVGTGTTNYALAASPASTSATIASLTASTVYVLVVKAIDTSGNVSAAYSTPVEVTTSASTDITPPGTLANLRETAAATYTTASLAWDTGTDNVAVSQTLIERCAGAGCTDFQTIRSTSGTVFADSTVKFGTTYRYRGKHRDTSLNVSTDYSSILTVVIPNPPAGISIGVCPCKTH